MAAVAVVWSLGGWEGWERVMAGLAGGLATCKYSYTI